jgi:tetratricopeptide (TPR) repeat protein
MRRPGVAARLIALALLLVGLGPEPVRAREPSAADQAIALYQGLLRRNPFDARNYYRLADACIQKARESGDPAYFERAEVALRKSLQLHPEYADAMRHLAFVLYSGHDFEGAAREARRAIALNPRDRQAHGILGDTLLEVGRYREAAEVYETMMGLGRDLFSLSRRAGLRSVRGDVDGAIEDLTQAIEAGRERGEPRESVAWAQWQLGSEHFLIGDLAAAEARYRDALATYPGYHRASAGLAQVRAAQGRDDEAVDLYKKALAVIPLPEYAAPLGDVYARLGRREDAQAQYALVEYIGGLSARAKALYNRELAYFYADHDVKLDRALELARKELEVRQDIYAHDLLAWALYKKGRAAEALPPMQVALSLGTKDPKLHFHAGLIYHALGHAGLARQHLGRALALNPEFNPLQAAVARRTLQALEAAAR